MKTNFYNRSHRITILTETTKMNICIKSIPKSYSINGTTQSRIVK